VVVYEVENDRGVQKQYARPEEAPVSSERADLERNERGGRSHDEPRCPPPSTVKRPALDQRERAVDDRRDGNDSNVVTVGLGHEAFKHLYAPGGGDVMPNLTREPTKLLARAFRQEKEGDAQERFSDRLRQFVGDDQLDAGVIGRRRSHA
jgi:hypothetical protein